MKYKIDIPKPSAKRLESSRRLIIWYRSGWGGDSLVQEHEIPVGDDQFEFEFGPIKHKKPDVMDDDYHAFCIEYQNSTGSRKEKAEVRPEPVEE